MWWLCGLMAEIEGEGGAGFTDQDSPELHETRGWDVWHEACTNGNQWTGMRGRTLSLVGGAAEDCDNRTRDGGASKMVPASVCQKGWDFRLGMVCWLCDGDFLSFFFFFPLWTRWWIGFVWWLSVRCLGGSAVMPCERITSGWWWVVKSQWWIVVLGRVGSDGWRLLWWGFQVVLFFF